MNFFSFWFAVGYEIFVALPVLTVWRQEAGSYWLIMTGIISLIYLLTIWTFFPFADIRNARAYNEMWREYLKTMERLEREWKRRGFE